MILYSTQTTIVSTSPAFANNTKEAIEVCKELGEILGFARISELSPHEHDEMIGFVSQLTHCIAVTLMNCCDDENLKNYTGDSFRDLTRIADINDEMWSELFLENKKAHQRGSLHRAEPPEYFVYSKVLRQ